MFSYNIVSFWYKLYEFVDVSEHTRTRLKLNNADYVAWYETHPNAIHNFEIFSRLSDIALYT